MKVNIVMLAYERVKLTAQALDTLAAYTPRDLFNLTIVDDGSSWRVKEIADSSFERYTKINVDWTILTIDRSKHITGQARNLGVYWAEKYWGRGDYLYLSDNDTYFMPGWLDKLTRAWDIVEPLFPSYKLKLLGGWNHPFLQPQQRLALTETYKIALHDAIAGASQLMRWETWDKYGPLSANAPGVCQSEDWEFCQKIIKDGGKVGSIYPRVVFNCGLTNSFGQKAVGEDLVLKELQEAKRQYPDLYYE